MTSVRPALCGFLVLVFLCWLNPRLQAQAAESGRSARSLAQADADFTARNIEDNQNEIRLSQTAIARSKNSRIQELAKQMLDDHIAMLYSIQELSAAGSGSSGGNHDLRPPNDSAYLSLANAEAAMSGMSGTGFDTTWVGQLLIMHESKLDELTQAAATVYNPRLKTAITEAIPKTRKHRDQLRSIKKALAKSALQSKKAASVQ